jgi:signal transduction histidine kinase
MASAAYQFRVVPTESAETFRGFGEEDIDLSELVSTSMLEEIVGSSDAISRVTDQILKVVRCGATVLIAGESGAGKELVARALHRNSNRSHTPIICVNFAATPSSLIAAQMFGHEEGAFTGANQRRAGRSEVADHGRWFLAPYHPLVEEGRPRKWYLTATEIESRKQEEERVRKENVRLEERTRIARELHDTLLQTFQSASMHLGAALYRVAQDSPVKPQLDRILRIMRQGIAEGRNAIQGLRSSGSQIPDLVVALSRIQEELEVPPDIDFRVIVTGRQRQLPREIQDEIYRIVMEALVNAFCHSGAKSVELGLEYSDTELRIRIRDNGCGIDPEVIEKGRDGHWGLAGMRERATRIGGLLTISSSATAGTEVELSIPGGIGLELSSSQHERLTPREP